MSEYELRGGARIGMANASFPFAKLKVNKHKLELNASIIGSLVFSPKDIASIEPHLQMPIIGKGLKINHTVSDYKQEVIFWTFKNPHDVIAEIKKTGFLENVNSDYSITDPAILAKQKQGGFPIKKSFAIGAVVVWNLLFAINFIGMFNDSNGGVLFGKSIMIAIGLLLGTAVLGLVSDSFRKLMLKEGRGLEDIKMFLYFIIVICCFFLLVIGAVPEVG